MAFPAAGRERPCDRPGLKVQQGEGILVLKGHDGTVPAREERDAVRPGVGADVDAADEARGCQVEDGHRPAVVVLRTVLADENGPPVGRHGELMRSSPDSHSRSLAAPIEVDERDAVPGLVGDHQGADERRGCDLEKHQSTSL